MNSHSASPTPTRKRTHLNPSQVATLQESFDTNPLPDSSVRSRLARELAVTERTIQIWFQNRRAKARKVEALGAFSSNSTSNASSTNSSTAARPGSSNWVDPHRHATPPRYQATFRTMMTPERFEELKYQDHQQIRKRPRSSSKPEPKSSHLLELTRSDNMRAMSEGISRPNHGVLFSASTSTPTTGASLSSTSIASPTSAGTVVQGGATSTTTATTTGSQMSSLITDTPIQTVPLPVSVLRIGSWTRFAHASPHLHQRDWDLVCYASPLDRELVWRVQAEGHHFRIQVSFDSIHQLRLSRQVQVETGELVGQLDIELSLPLAFSMWRFGQDHQWVRCGDFTEDKQASVDGFHILQGNHEAFKQTLLDLLALAPELATKISVTPNTNHNVMMMDLHQPPPGLDLCRDFTMSPSATPEPSSLAAAQAVAAQQMMFHGTNGLSAAYGMINPQQLSKANMSHLMLQAPFFYPTTTTAPMQGSNTAAPPHYQQQQQQSNEDLYQMLIHQQHTQPSSLLL
ncbi:hypothetical protein MAM1_0837d11288 [Mucor ambiguus]|uniref:Homeobox domain-containing protein n=1 Tax=Mucor ambiguus TaxID=91626 RepID=A0A0C9MLN0_9FUNG|nr:hypothetical protein MAM1_0837d11288 [Mucor ambiguus]